MLQFLPEAHVSKLLLDSAHDAMAYYEYCRDHDIQPFIDLNGKGGRPPVYKDDFTIDNVSAGFCYPNIFRGWLIRTGDFKRIHKKHADNNPM